MACKGVGGDHLLKADDGKCGVGSGSRVRVLGQDPVPGGHLDPGSGYRGEIWYWGGIWIRGIWYQGGTGI